MTTLEQLAQTIRADRHVASGALGERLYGRVEAMLHSATDRDTVYSALDSLSREDRERGQPVERDAVAEVLDAFDSL